MQRRQWQILEAPRSPNQARAKTGLDHIRVVHQPRLLSDNGPCYVSRELAEYLETHHLAHTRGAPYHPMTQGKIERYRELCTKATFSLITKWTNQWGRSRRWIVLAEEIATHDRHFARLTNETSPTLREGFGVGASTAAEMLIIFGDNLDRIRSEAAFAKLCGACPIPASFGMTTGQHRLYRGGHRQANAALYRAVIVRMRLHQPTVDYVARRTADGRTKRAIIRCLKRFLAREIYQRVMTDFRTRQHLTQTV